jgi:hypothetical protein
MQIHFLKFYKKLDLEIFKYKNEPQTVGEVRSHQPPIKDLNYDPLVFVNARWSDSENEYIRGKWKDLTDKQMAHQLFRTPRGVGHQRLILGLKRKRAWE